MLSFTSNWSGRLRNLPGRALGLGVLFLTLGSTPAFGQVCGDGVQAGGEGCDVPASSCVEYENGSGGCNLYVDGNPLNGTCTTGADCFYAFSCCKFNCNFVGSGASCNDDNPCTAGETCDQNGACGAPGNIDTTATNALAGDACGDQTDTQCDNPNTCSGAVNQGAGDIGFCQDNFEPDTTICVGANNGDLCDDDAADHCSGIDDTCIDEYRTPGSICRADTGQCDVAEACDGVSSACPADAFEPNSVLCVGSSNGATCDNDPGDRCSGVDTSCVDAFQANTFPCIGSSTGSQCDDDAGDHCSGTDALCVDGFQPNSVACTGSSQSGVCDDDAGDRCSGVDTTCNDAYQSNTIVCRAAAGVCDAVDYCTGSAGACPVDAKEATTVECRAGNECDAAEFCDGSGNDCPPDILASAGTVCRAGSGSAPGDDLECDPEEVCDGINPTCPFDVLQPAGTVCNGGSGDPNVSGTICDPEEVCNGVSGVACPSDTILSAGTVCRAGSGDLCDPDETCSGVADQACGVDIFEPATTVCRPGSGTPNGGIECDTTEMCPGAAGLTCPADVIEAAGKLCRDQLGECDYAEECSGLNGDPCPVDLFVADDTACYTDPPIDHTPHQPLPSGILPCDSGECVCESGYCVAPDTLVLTKGKLAVDINYDKPNGAAQFRAIVFDNETDTVVPLGDLRGQLLSNTAAIRFSDEGDFDTTIKLDNCVERGKGIKCKGPTVKAKFRIVSDTEAVWEVQAKVKGLRVTSTGYAPLEDKVVAHILQPDEFYQVIRTGALTAGDDDCKKGRAESLLNCKVN